MTGIAHKWQFASRFRRHAFGWRSDTPIQRIKEALAEIKQVARKEPVLAAEGAVTLLEKLSPALEQVDSSSGALGSAVNKAIETLVPIIVKADVEPKQRQRWLDRLWQALQDDEMPYIELLGDPRRQGFRLRSATVRHQCSLVSAAMDCTRPRLRDHRRGHPGHSQRSSAGKHAGWNESTESLCVACADSGRGTSAPSSASGAVAIRKGVAAIDGPSGHLD